MTFNCIAQKSKIRAFVLVPRGLGLIYIAFVASNFIRIMLASQTSISMVPQNWEPYQNAKTNFETFEGISIVNGISQRCFNF
jgi:hypothetical protein